MRSVRMFLCLVALSHGVVPAAYAGDLPAAHPDGQDVSSLTQGIVLRLPFEDSLDPSYLVNGKVTKVGKGVRLTDGFGGRALQTRYNNPLSAGVSAVVRGALSSKEGTISVWVRPDWLREADSRGTCLLTVNTLFRVYWQRPLIRFASYGRGKWVWGPGASAEGLDPAGWRHLVITYGNDGKRIYIDGQLKGEDEYNDPGQAWMVATISLAHGSGDELRPGMDAAFDELVVWGRALSESDVERLHALYTTRREELLSAFPVTAPAESQPVRILMAETDRRHWIWSPGETITMRTRLIEEPDRLSRRVRYHHEVVDYHDKVRKTFPVREKVMPVGQALVEEVSFSLDEYGVFKLVEHLEVPDAGFRISKDVASLAILPREIGKRGPVPDSRFGIHAASDGWHHEMARLVGAKWLRTLDFNQICWWNNVEPEKGKLIWYDDIAADILKNDMRILGTVFWTPRWASSMQNVPPDGIEYRYYPPKDWNDWARFAREIVSHYRGKIDHWEVWNEPNWAWKGTHEEYANLQRIFYEEAKKANPRCVVVGMGGVNDDLGWITKVAEAGTLDYMDALSIHGYEFDYADRETLAETRKFVDGLKDLIRGHGKGRRIPIWNTEWSSQSSSFFDEFRDGYGPEMERYHWRKAANRLVRRIVLGASMGFDKTFYYWMKRYDRDAYPDEVPTGTLLEFTGALTPVGVVHAQAAWVLEGAKFHGEHTFIEGLPAVAQDGVPVYVFSKGRGSVAVLWGLFGWDREIDPGLSIEVEGLRATLFDILGNPCPARNGSALAVPVKSEPVYIVADGVSAEDLLKKLKAGKPIVARGTQ